MILPATFIVLISLVFIANVYAIPIEIILHEPIISQKVEQTEGLFEGDIVLPPSQEGRSLVALGTSVRWPDGIVPYEIKPGYAAEQEAAIVNAIRRLENYVAIDNFRCVQFRPKNSSDLYYTSIQNGTGCSSPVGLNPDTPMNQTVTLQYPGCINDGTIMHELLHTLGFYHEQSRPDRECYVKVYLDNIIPGTEHNFQKYNNSASDTQNTPYDYNSIMHYENNAFSINGSVTIEPVQPNIKIGQRYFLSSIDIQAIRTFYNCTGSGTLLPPTTPINITTNSSDITSIYSSVLASSSPMYLRPDGVAAYYYYESIEVTFPTAGTYQLVSDNELDTYGSIYDSSFNSSDTSTALLVQNDDRSNSNWNFGFNIVFPAPRTLILVVTTYNPAAVGPFTIMVTGPSPVTFVRTSIISTSTTSTSTTTPASTTISASESSARSTASTIPSSTAILGSTAKMHQVRTFYIFFCLIYLLIIR